MADITVQNPPLQRVLRTFYFLLAVGLAMAGIITFGDAGRTSGFTYLLLELAALCGGLHLAYLAWKLRQEVKP